MTAHRFRPVAAVLALLLSGTHGMAIEATAKQREACAPDVFRLCKPHVPDVDKIVACMERERDKLSPACKVVFTPELLQGLKTKKQGEPFAEFKLRTSQGSGAAR
jgi:hypothetical protein